MLHFSEDQEAISAKILLLSGPGWKLKPEDVW